MFVVANFLFALGKVLSLLLSLYMWVVIARAILSWVMPDLRNPVVGLLYQLTEPVLWRIRRYLPLQGVGIDVSPVILILAIIFLRRFVVATLFDVARRM